MRVLEIESDDIKIAKKLYSFYNLKNSITEGRSQLYGAVGEVMVAKYYNATYVGNYDYDLLISNHKVDVKTKRTSHQPKPFYLCSIAATNIKQECDFYYFVRVRTDLSLCYLLGYLPKDKFFEIADFKKKGDSDVNNFVFKEDCYNVPVSELWLK